MENWISLKSEHYDREEINNTISNLSKFRNLEKKDIAYYDGLLKKWFINPKEPLNYLVFAKWLPRNGILPSFDISELKNTSIHIGQNISQKLLSKMNEAKERVYILSPYTSTVTVDLFEFLQSKKVNCKLLFSTSIQENNTKIFKNFINYKIINNDKAEQENFEKIENLKFEKSRKIKNNTVLSFFLFFAFIIFILIYYFYLFPKYSKSGALISGVIFLILFIKILSSKNNLKNLVKNIENEIEESLKKDFRDVVYYQSNNSYRYLFEETEKSKQIKDPLKIDFNRLTFSHTKLYILDNVAYLGSMNFSSTSFSNLESLIEIGDINAVNQLAEYFLQLYSSDKFGTKSDEVEKEIGSRLYPKEKILKK